MAHLVDPSALADLLGSGAPVRLLDVRWRLDAPEGRPAYLAGHLPGAVYVDLEQELSAPHDPQRGRYPPPSVADLEAAVRRWGVRAGDTVVAYDDNDAVAAAHAWWVLRGVGLDVAVLDGGVRAWVAAGFALEQGDHAPPRGDLVLRAGDRRLADIDEAARAPVHGHLVDVRSPDHYRGVAAGIDPVAGHIPGAVNIPTVSYISPGGGLRRPDEVRSTLSAVGIDTARPIVLYCSVGIASSHSALALALADIEARVYAGAWSQWSRTPGRPVAVGRTPTDVLQGW